MFNPDAYIVFTVESKVPGNTITIKDEKKKIAQDNAASEECVNATKEKWARAEEYKDTVSTINKYRNLIYDKSSPWGKRSGERIATKEMWLNEIEALASEAENEVGKKVVTFISKYEEVVNHAKAKLGKLYVSTDYPKRDEIKSNFYIFVGGGAAPDPDDNVTFGSPEVEKRFKERMEKKIKMNLDIIIDEINDKVVEIVGRVVDRLENYTITEDGKVKNMFRDSLITNSRDLADIIKYMNINNNPDVEKIRVKILDDVCKYDPSELRESPHKRESVAKEAREILNGLSGMTRS